MSKTGSSPAGRDVQPIGAHGQWRVDDGRRVAWYAPTCNDDLRPVVASVGVAVWQVVGRRPRLGITAAAEATLLRAGWYELRMRLDTGAGVGALPSVCLHYVAHSALQEIEVVLPEPDAARRIRTVVLCLEDVRSIEFVPEAGPHQVGVSDFSVRWLSRFEALRRMLAGSACPGEAGRMRRLLAWLRDVRSRGLKRATDTLYASYRRRAWPAGVDEYTAWRHKYDVIDPGDLAQRVRRIEARGPLISLLLAVASQPDAELRRCLDGVIGQAWGKWELRVAIAASADRRTAALLADYVARDARIRIIESAPTADRATALGAALAAAVGQWAVLLTADAVLRPHALLRIAECSVANPGRLLWYWDVDRIDAMGAVSAPDFKPDWNPDLLLGCNYVGRVVAIDAGFARRSGSLQAGAGCSGVFDLIWRCGEVTARQPIGHIPEILHHRSAGGDALAAGDRQAVIAHLQRTGDKSKVEWIDHQSALLRVRPALPDPVPRVSLIIPTRDHVRLLRQCVESILARSSYPDLELLVVDNQSRDPAALAYLEALTARPCVRVMHYDAPFNYSAINNWAARQATGDVVALVNNDIEVITPAWLEEMVGWAVRAETGAVGALLYYPDDTIQHAGMVLGLNGIAGHIYAGEPRSFAGARSRARLVQNVSAVTGACLVVRRRVFAEAGGLDERLPVEFNDVDFCLRLRQRGYWNVWTPFAELYHHESASRGIASDAATKTRHDEVALMRARWGEQLSDDPAYNPNLSLQRLDGGLAFPPRRRRGQDRASAPL